MSLKELDRLKVIEKVIDRRLTQSDAATQLQITPRQVRRLVASYRSEGSSGLVSKKRGSNGNRSYPERFKQNVLLIIQDNYHDFGPTLIREKLIEKHSISLSLETIRRWLIDAGVWQSRSIRAQRAYQPRYRRECYGELIQIDGSEHRWFEDRGPKCTLLVYIDDATGKLMEQRFTPSESTFDYFHSTKRYLQSHGKPVAFYSDKHTVFRVNKTGATSGTGLTQFGRALHELNIDIIYANSSQAKGRVERMNKTLQDRLVKEMRLENISTIEDGNNFLPKFIDSLNTKFSKDPANPTDLHRPLSDFDNLEEILCWQEERTVSNSLTLQYDRVLYLLQDNVMTRGLRRKKVTVFDYPGGTISVKHEGTPLPYTVFDKTQQVTQEDIVSNKRLGAVLAHAKVKQDELGRKQRSKRTPKRRGQQQIADAEVKTRNVALQP